MTLGNTVQGWVIENFITYSYFEGYTLFPTKNLT